MGSTLTYPHLSPIALDPPFPTRTVTLLTPRAPTKPPPTGHPPTPPTNTCEHTSQQSLTCRPAPQQIGETRGVIEVFIQLKVRFGLYLEAAARR